MRCSRSCLSRSRPGLVSAPGSRYIDLNPYSVSMIILYCCWSNVTLLFLLLIYRHLLPLVTTMAMWVLEWSAPKRWPQPSVVPSSWPSCPLSPSGEAIGVTRSESPTPCPARWQAAAALSWCVWFLPPVVLASCLPLCPRSCSWWLVSMTATPLPGAALPPLATLVRNLSQSPSIFSLLCSASPLQWCGCRYQERKKRVL